jgi:hypothetical protein
VGDGSELVKLANESISAFSVRLRVTCGQWFDSKTIHVGSGTTVKQEFDPEDSCSTPSIQYSPAKTQGDWDY